VTTKPPPIGQRPAHRYTLNEEEVEILVDALEMRREYLALAVDIAQRSRAGSDEVDRDLALTDALLDRLGPQRSTERKSRPANR
jgi:hypothetical protein